MSNCPGIYHDIGKKARDVLYRDYPQPSAFNNSKLYDCNIDLACHINEIVPGLGTAFRFDVPHQSKVEMQYMRDYAGITAGIGVAENPLLNFSGVSGTGFFSAGADMSFNIVRRKFDECNAGLSFSSATLMASLTMNDLCNTLRATCHYTVNPLTNTAIAGEFTHKFLGNETVVTIGTQHALFPITLLKARVSTNGRVGAVIQHQLFPSLYLTVAGAVDVTAIARSAKFGLSMAIKPN